MARLLAVARVAVAAGPAVRHRHVDAHEVDARVDRARVVALAPPVRVAWTSRGLVNAAADLVAPVNGARDPVATVLRCTAAYAVATPIVLGAGVPVVARAHVQLGRVRARAGRWVAGARVVALVEWTAHDPDAGADASEAGIALRAQIAVVARRLVSPGNRPALRGYMIHAAIRGGRESAPGAGNASLAPRDPA